VAERASVHAGARSSQSPVAERPRRARADSGGRVARARAAAPVPAAHAANVGARWCPLHSISGAERPRRARADSGGRVARARAAAPVPAARAANVGARFSQSPVAERAATPVPAPVAEQSANNSESRGPCSGAEHPFMAGRC